MPTLLRPNCCAGGAARGEAAPADTYCPRVKIYCAPAAQEAALAGKLRQQIAGKNAPPSPPSGFAGALPNTGSIVPQEVAITNATEPLLKLRKRTAPLKVGGADRARFWDTALQGQTTPALGTSRSNAAVPK